MGQKPDHDDDAGSELGDETELEKKLNHGLGQAIHLILLALAVVVLLAAAIDTVYTVLQIYPLLFRRSDEYQALSRLIQQVLLIGIAAELAQLLINHRTGVAVDVIVFVIARKIVNPDTSVVNLLLSVIALCGLIVVRYFFLSSKRR